MTARMPPCMTGTANSTIGAGFARTAHRNTKASRMNKARRRHCAHRSGARPRPPRNVADKRRPRFLDYPAACRGPAAPAERCARSAEVGLCQAHGEAVRTAKAHCTPA